MRYTFEHLTMSSHDVSLFLLIVSTDWPPCMLATGSPTDGQRPFARRRQTTNNFTIGKGNSVPYKDNLVCSLVILI
ncbi:uncharacterized protein HD556DRAFT_1394894 [Suillus plorans]|uniref:Uncharacterized protein n=1 Tax=Suillus plorans TaxID=116603 RepID=A0A9P7DES7_9AGAM|nr:uncharacterized protein HD556DRAFT_1394894 [Suillus plorans]KAG1789990.1 hypothetical protein HD556DRAFT_1394894 [Suillus plorans]